MAKCEHRFVIGYPEHRPSVFGRKPHSHTNDGRWTDPMSRTEANNRLRDMADDFVIFELVPVKPKRRTKP